MTNVLIIDDDNSFRELVIMRLKKWRKRCEIFQASSLEEAREVHKSFKGKTIDVLILDQHLPDGHGLDFLDELELDETAVLAVSADEAPEITADAVRAGAMHFLQKRQVSEALFIPLIDALLSRKKLENKLLEIQLKESKLKTIKLLVATLRHEINNPLGAVLGGAYLLKSSAGMSEDQKEALRLIEESSHRIKHVLEKLCTEMAIEEVEKGDEKVFQIPGDKKWD